MRVFFNLEGSIAETVFPGQPVASSVREFGVLSESEGEEECITSMMTSNVVSVHGDGEGENDKLSIPVKWSGNPVRRGKCWPEGGLKFWVRATAVNPGTITAGKMTAGKRSLNVCWPTSGTRGRTWKHMKNDALLIMRSREEHDVVQAASRGAEKQAAARQLHGTEHSRITQHAEVCGSR